MTSYDGGNRARLVDLAALRAQTNQRRLHRRRTEERDPRDTVRGRQVFLHQDRRERQHVGDVVEAVTGIVLREVVCGSDVHAQQFFDRVVVLGAVQAARGHPAGIRRRRRVNPTQLARQPRGHGLTLLFGRLLLLERRHLAAPELADDLVPLITMFDERRGRLERLEVEVVLLLLLAVAGEAVLREKGFDDGIEAGRRVSRLRRPCWRWRRRSCGARGLRCPLGGAHDDERTEKGENEERPHAPPTRGGAFSGGPADLNRYALMNYGETALPRSRGFGPCPSWCPQRPLGRAGFRVVYSPGVQRHSRLVVQGGRLCVCLPSGSCRAWPAWQA